MEEQRRRFFDYCQPLGPKGVTTEKQQSRKNKKAEETTK